MNKATVLVGGLLIIAALASGCESKSDEQKLVDQMEKLAQSGDPKQVEGIFDLDLRLRADVVAQLRAAKPADVPILAKQVLPQLGDPAALAQQRDSALKETLGGGVGDDLKLGGCRWSAEVSAAEASAFAVPETQHGMPVQLHNAIVDLNNAVGGMEVGHLSCESGHEYPMALVRRRADGAPWKVLRVGLPPPLHP